MFVLWWMYSVRAGVYGTWPLFFPLTFTLAMPIIIARNPACGVHQSALPRVRTASLAGDRGSLIPMPRWGWFAVWGLFLVLLAVIGLRPVLSPIEGVGASQAWLRWKIGLGMAIFEIPLLIATPALVRMALRNPEPMDAANTPELAEMYAVLRSRTARFMTTFLLGMVILMIVSMAILTWFESANDGQTVAWASGIFGATMGLISTCGVIWMAAQRMRINQFLREISQEQHCVIPG